MQISEIKKVLSTYKNTGAPKKDYTNYERGYYNGLETAAAMLDDRPAFLLNMHNEFNKGDIEAYPEYFL